MPLLVTIVSTSETFRFDPITERWNHHSQATQHPVEKGVDVTDHVQEMPVTYSCEVLLNDSKQANISNLPNEAQGAKAFLLRCQSQILVISNGFQVNMTNMVLLGWPQTRNNFAVLPTTLDFQQIRIAQGRSALIPRPISGLRAGGFATEEHGDLAGIQDSVLFDALTAITGSVPASAASIRDNGLQGLVSSFLYGQPSDTP